MAQQIQLRNGTAAQWASANPTLAVGELGVETDTSRFKIGTGSTAWTSLTYVSGIGSLPSQTSNSGKYLTTDGTSVSWGTITGLTGITNSASPYLTALGSGSGTSTTGINVVAVGYQALNSNTTGSYNNAFGYQALYSVTTGETNCAFGWSSLKLNTANQNSAFGHGTLQANTTGTRHVAVGNNALATNTTGTQNTGVGQEALVLNTTGSYNVALGQGGLRENTTASNNTALGWNSAYNTTTGAHNTGVGYQTLYSNSTGERNVAIGASSNSTTGTSAMYLNTTGAQNTAVGAGALRSNTTGNNITAVGFGALYSNTGTGENIAVGSQALYNNTTGGGNVGIGYLALYNNTTASYNIGIGPRAGYTLSTGGGYGGQDNVFIGASAGYASNSSAFGNVGIGTSALERNTTGSANIAIGGQSTPYGDRAPLSYNTTGTGNIALGGYSCLGTNTTGNYNIAIGANALRNNSTGVNHVAIGFGALNSATDNNNIAIGYRAGYGLTSANNIILIGTDAGYNGVTYTTASQSVIIGNYAYGSVNNEYYAIVIGYGCNGLGGDYVTLGKLNNRVYCRYDTNATWIQASDVRLKKNIESDSLGLSFINRLNPVKYQWKATNELELDNPQYNEENNKNTTTVMHGLIAQEVKAALEAEGVDTFGGWHIEPNGIQGVSREMFVTPLINAIKELSAEVASLKSQVNQLKGV
jgi:hypothetical protein